MTTVHGLHHVTAMAGDPAANHAFYTGVLGLRLVKRSVNQDDPGTYHLFYADGAGTPGTDLTFFPWPTAFPAREGSGAPSEVAFAVPAASLGYWRGRLASEGVGFAEEVRFGEPALAFRDPHTLRLALVGIAEDRAFVPVEGGPVPAAHQIRGMHAVRLVVRTRERTAILLTDVLGFSKRAEDGDWHRYAVEDGRSGTLVDVREDAGAPPARLGPGGIHHVAWRVADDAEEMALQERLVRVGLRPTPQVDRFWFRSVYFREPGGVLFELATDGPGFSADEDPAHLGEALVLPPWLEPRRAEIEAALPPLSL